LGEFNLIFETNLRDEGLSRELAAEKIHEPLTTRVLAEMIKPNWVVVDIGSHLGYFALFEACLVETNGKVIAIEPVPESYILLVKNVKLNDLTKTIATHNIAVSSKRENRDFFISKLSNQSGFYPMPEYENVIKVETVSLDEILKNETHVDAIRMDIEGGEYEVISGMIETIRLHHPLLLIELHPSPKRKSFLRELHNLGYECLYTIERGQNTSLFHGVMADSRDILGQSITSILQAEDNEYVYLVVLIHQS
jgi:FkbM family methyltransferase